MNILKLGTLILLGISVSAVMQAAIMRPPDAPEIDAGSGVNALALAAGTLLVLRGRKK